MSDRKTVVFRTSTNEQPAASRTAPGLRLHALGDLAGRGVQPDLAGAEHEIGTHDGLAVWPERRRGSRCRDRLSGHVNTSWPGSRAGRAPAAAMAVAMMG